jgi:hypothetical protein
VWGIIKSRLGNDGSLLTLHVDATGWGFNVGAGAMFFLSDRFGLRGDLRYFRSLQDNEPTTSSTWRSGTSGSGAGRLG